MHEEGPTTLALFKVRERQLQQAAVQLLDRQWLFSGSKRPLRRDELPPQKTHSQQKGAGAFRGSQPPIYPNPYFRFHTPR